MNRYLTLSIALCSSSVFAFSCASPPADPIVFAQEDDALVGGRAGALYTMTNDATANAIVVYRRAKDGSLQQAASYTTTGKGSGDGLGSQGALTLSVDRHWLFAVNAGSNELSTFYVENESLYLVDVIATGGERPISVTEHNGIVYVLHAGGINSIAGFRQHDDGSLEAIPGSVMPLSVATAGPAQISFSARGHVLLVTEKATNSIDEFRVDPPTGIAKPAVVHASNGKTPFGFAITKHGQAVVSEAFGGTPGAGAASSYQIGNSAGLTSVTASAPDGQGAPCWVVLAHNDKIAFVSNTASGNISRYDVAKNGALSIAASGSDAGTTGAGTKPIDMAISRDDRFLYVLNSATASLSAFRVGKDGLLTPAGTTTGLAATSVGLAGE